MSRAPTERPPRCKACRDTGVVVVRLPMKRHAEPFELGKPFEPVVVESHRPCSCEAGKFRASKQTREGQ